MKDYALALALLVSAAGYGWAADDDDDDRATRVSARLDPRNEVPAVSSPARGTFRATIDDGAGTLDYQLTFDGLQAEVRQAHIHFAQPLVNGAIMVWLCGTATNPGPAGTQLCPQSGTITGTITGAAIQTISTQGIATGEFSEFAAAIRGGLAYVNVHTAQSTGGEIRGQIRARD
jgi:hypothetical protein